MDKFGNKAAREGLDRCFCGCKYWENDLCTDCQTHIDAVRNSWPPFQAEILGRIPIGLSANDVAASVVSMMRENVMLIRWSKSQPLPGMVAVQLHFRAVDEDTAETALRYAYTGVNGFSADYTLRSKR